MARRTEKLERAPETRRPFVWRVGPAGALSARLAFAALPFLAFSGAAYQPPALGIPAPQLAVNLSGSVIFQLAIFAIALVIAGMCRAVIAAHW